MAQLPPVKRKAVASPEAAVVVAPRKPIGKAKKPPREKKAPITVPTPEEEASAMLLYDEGSDRFVPLNWLMRYNEFAMSYLTTGDPVAASVVAGFVGSNEQSQKAIASRLMTNKTVLGIVEKQYRSIVAKTGATVERVWEEISYTAFADIGAAYTPEGVPLPMEQIPEELRRAITGFKVVTKTFGEDGESTENEIKFGAKDAALEKLMRLHRMVDNDKLVVVNGDEFLQRMNEGRERAAKR